jgi:hypothetical protein
MTTRDRQRRDSELLVLIGYVGIITSVIIMLIGY